MRRIDAGTLLRSLELQYIGPGHFEAAAALCRGNPLYYEHYGAPPPGPAEILQDLEALPPGKGYEDKYYLGGFDGGQLRLLLDLIDGHPDEGTAWIGFFMLDARLQGLGLGSRLVSELLGALGAYGFRRAALGVVAGNPQAEAFWRKNGFEFYGEPRSGRQPVIRTMQRMLGADTNMMEEET